MAHDSRLVFDPELERKIRQVAGLPGDVLLTGPTGSGKSRVARWIYELGAEKKGPFVAQNCAAIPKELADRELFGHVRGAFTSADKDAPGIVAAADGGTLFLDEIGELPISIQAKLLTLLQDRVYRPLGSVTERSARFRLVAATNRDLVELCNQGLFREDLYHRINEFSLKLPALCDVPEHAQRIAAAELDRMSLQDAHREQALAAVGRLSRHPAAWPGNIRELLTFLKRCVLDVEEQERLLVGEWMRWRRSDTSGPLTPFAPPRSPSMADRERYAGLLQQSAGQGTRPKAVGSREVSLALASRLLEALPHPLPMDEVQAVLGVRDRRSVDANLAFLEERGLVRSTGDGVVAVWPPASSTLFELCDDEWIPVGEGTIASVSHGDRVRIKLITRCAGTLRVALVTHGPLGPSEPEVILAGQDLRASRPVEFDIAFDERGGLEQILLHVGLPAARGGRLIEPMRAEGIMPDSAALERGRRSVLGLWREGWMHEHLVFHARRR
jgi:Sigma-54 interaction domain